MRPQLIYLQPITLSLTVLYIFQVQASGFVSNPDHPWIGASPDGMITCTCHGDGVLEIKYPFNSKDCSLFESYKEEEDGAMALKTDHKYMY